MKLAVVENENGHMTVVNADHVTFLRQDAYGTSVHFTSGEYIVCPQDMDFVINRLQDVSAPETLLIKTKA